MCVSCHEPLALAQSPQADSERAFVSMLIAKGLTKAQIENQLVAQYGPSVLGKPPAHGFNLTVPATAQVGGTVQVVASATGVISYATLATIEIMSPGP